MSAAKKAGAKKAATTSRPSKAARAAKAVNRSSASGPGAAPAVLPASERASSEAMQCVDALRTRYPAIDDALRAELLAIYDDHVERAPFLESYARGVAELLRHAPGVHSYRSRVKDPAHLLDKVLRKHAEGRRITFDTYRSAITDLAGVRALHLYKADWRTIDLFIRSTWRLAEKPFAYFREGDPAEVIAGYRDAGLKVRRHPHGYRSVHYLVVTSPTLTRSVVEVQVRTIFEEGFSEIDHHVRYPNVSDNPLLAELIGVFNRLAGSADELGTLVRTLADYVRDVAEDKRAAAADLRDARASLDTTVRSLELEAATKDELLAKIKRIEQLQLAQAADVPGPLAAASASAPAPPHHARRTSPPSDVSRSFGALSTQIGLGALAPQFPIGPVGALGISPTVANAFRSINDIGFLANAGGTVGILRAAQSVTSLAESLRAAGVFDQARALGALSQTIRTTAAAASGTRHAASVMQAAARAVAAPQPGAVATPPGLTLPAAPDTADDDGDETAPAEVKSAAPKQSAEAPES